MQSLVRIKGLEPPRLSAPDPKSGVATNYTISALVRCKGSYFFAISNLTLSFLSKFCEKVLNLHIVNDFLCQRL